jgi:hypothetical protein
MRWFNDHLKLGGAEKSARLFSPACSVSFYSVQPEINVEEKIGRTVGKRIKPPTGLSLQVGATEDAIAWRQAFGGVRIPRGVFRFKSHQEADAWLWKMITRHRPS